MSVASNQHRTRSHRKVAIACACVAVGMVGAAYAAVPLYKLYCQVTGFGGTTQRAIKPSETMLDKVVTVRFDANVGPDLPWEFVPVQRTVEARLGENVLVFYRATNTSKATTRGTATFNVTPEQAGAYFAKVQCFCFTEQTLEPGETIEMPVSFFVDPDILKDKDGRSIDRITLSYTFYPVDPRKPSAATQSESRSVPAALPVGKGS